MAITFGMSTYGGPVNLHDVVDFMGSAFPAGNRGRAVSMPKLGAMSQKPRVAEKNGIGSGPAS